MLNEACLEEFETLRAIFLDDIKIEEEDDSALVSMILFPATGDDKDSRYVTLTLDFHIDQSYPKSPPTIRVRNPRGLNDIMLEDLIKLMTEKSQERVESQMIFELIDMAKEFLTSNNRPASECPICLSGFSQFDVFFRSTCFHYFHSYCLGSYLNSGVSNSDDATEKPTCPVCREILTEELDINKLLNAPPPAEDSAASLEKSAELLQDWEAQRQLLGKLFEKQKIQGGIIDLSKTGAKLLVISEGNSGAEINDDSNTFLEAEAEQLFPPSRTADNGDNHLLAREINRTIGTINDSSINGNSEYNTRESSVAAHRRPTSRDRPKVEEQTKDCYRNRHEVHRGKRRHK